MYIVQRNTGEVINPIDFERLRSSGYTEEAIQKKCREYILKTFYNPYYAQYLAYSPIMNALVEEYKDAELVPYTPSKYELECIAKDPSYAENIPQYYVPGFDRRASSEAMDGRLKNEFWEGWKNDKPFVMKFVNMTNPYYKVVKS